MLDLSLFTLVFICNLIPKPCTPRFYLTAMEKNRDKIWEWPGDKATSSVHLDPQSLLGLTRVSYTHHSIPFSTPYTTPAITATRHSVYNELKISAYPCYIAPQTPACTFDALTSSPSIFYETLMHHATRSGSPRNALLSPSYYFWHLSFRIFSTL